MILCGAYLRFPLYPLLHLSTATPIKLDTALHSARQTHATMQPCTLRTTLRCPDGEVVVDFERLACFSSVFDAMPRATEVRVDDSQAAWIGVLELAQALAADNSSPPISWVRGCPQ